MFQLNTAAGCSRPHTKGAKAMEVLVPLGILVAWFVLQAWVLPRFGVKT
jgi:hypothetical protein